MATYERWMPKKYDDLQRRLRDLEAVRLLAERSEDLDAFLTEIAIDPPEVARDGGDDEDGIVENKDGNKLKEAIKQVRKQGFK